MEPNTPSVPSTEPQPAEKETWTPPVLKKMDIEETAIGSGIILDADGAS